MEKSIETIWKEGFLDQKALVAPTLNDLYNKKSKHIIDKLARMFRANLVGIMIGATLISSIFILGGSYLPGILVFMLFTGLVIHSRKNAITLRQINKGATSYDYLKSFLGWLETMMEKYARLYRFFYPSFILLFGWGMYTVSYPKFFDQSMLERLTERPETTLWLGLPIFYVVPIVILAIGFSIFSKPIYKLDVYSIYGPTLNKLRELVRDMEELKQES